MKDRKMLRLKISFAVLGVLFLVPILILFINFKRWDGVFSLMFIISILVYGYIYRNVLIFRNRDSRFIYKTFDVIQIVTLSLIALIAIILGSIFWAYEIALPVGASFITFGIHSGFEFVVFDYKSRTIDGLFRDGEKCMDDLSLKISADNSQLEIKILNYDSLIIGKEMYGESNWTILMDCFKLIEKGELVIQQPKA